MKTQILRYILPLAALLTMACTEDNTDGIDKSTRVYLSPEPELFAADGRTDAGEESYVGVVVVNTDNGMKNRTWEATADKEWVTVTQTDVTTSFTETWTGATSSVVERAVEVKVEPNTEYRRQFVLSVRVADGTVVPFAFEQLGAKADAAVSAARSVEFVAAGAAQTIDFTTNMGDVYDFSAKYGAESADWLTWTSDQTGKVTLTASAWSDKTQPRTAVFTITVGSEQTSIASCDIEVLQLAQDDYYYMYGPSCNGILIANAIQLTKSAVGIYSGESYFLASDGGKNPVMINRDSRALSYPCYCLAADGTIAELASATTALPAGPAIDIDGRRSVVLNFTDKTWTWSRITVANCMPDTEVAKYTTKEFVARDGSMKTWMTEFVRWDGGDISPKLGSGMVATATGAGASGTGGYAAGAFPQSWNDASVLDMTKETTEIGGNLACTSENGRIYTFNEMVTGVPHFGIGHQRYEALPESWQAGGVIVDALGRTIVSEYLNHKSATTFSGDNTADEVAHPMLTMQVQGICPYGWHVANASDWLDLAYAACKASAGHTFPMQEDQITYKQFTTASGTMSVDNPVSPRGIGNFAPWLRNKAHWTAGNISDGADVFGFNYYPLGFRYMTQGFQCAGTRCQTWVPLCYDNSSHPGTATFRINVIINNTVTAVEMTNLDNGQAVAPFRCVKNYKK